MLKFTVDVTAADTGARTIEGVAVPYGETAVLNGTRYSFTPGSLELARPRTPLLLSHNAERPVGVLSKLTERDEGLGVVFAIDRTPDGDAALEQASSGSRGGLSIGAEVDDYDELDGVRVVSAARILEMSLVPLSAFAGANVERVAAELETESEGDEPDEPEGDEPDTEEDQVETVEAGSPVMLAASVARPKLSTGEYALALAGAQRGDPDALNVVRAALTESSIANLTGVLPPQYVTDIVGGKEISRVLYGIFGGRPLPSSGLAIVKPVWGVTPAGAWLTTVVDDAPSNAATILTKQANVEAWAWGIAIPYVLATRSDPDVITAMYSQAVQDFYADTETKILAKLQAVAATAGVTTIGAAVAAFANQSGGKTPDIIIAAADVWGLYADASKLSSANGLGAVVAGNGGLASSFAGIDLVVASGVASKTVHLATRRAIDARVTNPVRLTANAVGALNVELGVVGEGLFDTDYVSEILTASTLVLGGFSADDDTRSKK